MLKSFLAKIYAKFTAQKVYHWVENPVISQKQIFENLISNAKHTAFGKDHNFENIKTPEDFKKLVPIRDYETLKPYVERVKRGEEDILWKGKPIYFAKTSGTTSGAKYIPITKESMSFQISAAKEALLLYIFHTGNADYVNGKMIFLQGSPELNEKNGINTGRLSGIVAHFVPSYLQKNRMPSWETNCIDDWETKLSAIIDETIVEDMRLISGIPSWVQMYFEKLNEKEGKKVSEIFPNFSLFVYGGVNYEPYRQKMENLTGKKVDSIELFPASEGFFAYQDSNYNNKNSTIKDGMLLLLNHGIFYEFIPADEFFDENPTRITIENVKVGVNYVMIISTNAGLWAYNLGDTIEFISVKPYRIIVTGRIKHFISAFGEHVIGKEVESALQEVIAGTNIKISEFTVAPQVNPKEGELPYHEWFIEFENEPDNLTTFAEEIDQAMQKQNSYYFDLLDGNILQTLKISKVVKKGFHDYMKSVGKLGGQNKIPRLANDRKIADKLEVL
ncbi:MAG: GH3 auxin-responsive promoter family protein [Bacteroidota bacterium]